MNTRNGIFAGIIMLFANKALLSASHNYLAAVHDAAKVYPADDPCPYIPDGACGYRADNTRIKTILTALDLDIAAQQTDEFPHTMALMHDPSTSLQLQELFSLNSTAAYVAAQKIGLPAKPTNSSILTKYLSSASFMSFTHTNRLMLDFYQPLINIPNDQGIMPLFSCIHAPRYVIGLYVRGARIDAETVSAAQEQLKKYPALLATLFLLHDNKALLEPFMPKSVAASPLPFRCDGGGHIPTALTYIEHYTSKIDDWIAEEKAHLSAVAQQDPAYLAQLKDQMHIDAQIVSRPVIRDVIRFTGRGDQE